MKAPDYPIKTTPCYKQMPWGGTNLNKYYGKHSPYEFTGESWEAASHKNGETAAAQGPVAGLSPRELAERFGKDFLGSLANPGKGFPVLYKLIDARDRLSVQVHPDDALARADGDNGKTEMWFVLRAEERAGLYLGFGGPMDEKTYREKIESNSLEGALRFVPAHAGDAFFLPAGLVHAIGAGLVIAEIQQNSDATYRVYDWGRLGLDGKPRPLHIEKAVAATRTELRGGKAKSLFSESGGARREHFTGCPLFAAQRVVFAEKAAEDTGKRSFHIVFINSGGGTISSPGGESSFSAGDTFIIPACAGCYSLSGEGEYYKFFLPDYNMDYLAPLTAAGHSEAEIAALFERVR